MEEKQAYLDQIASLNEQISSMQNAMYNSGLSTRSAIQDELDRLNRSLASSRDILDRIEGRVSYQQAAPKQDRMIQAANAASMRVSCGAKIGPEPNPIGYTDPLFGYLPWEDIPQIGQMLWNSVEFSIGGGFGGGGKVNGLANLELSYILWGGNISYSPLTGFDNITKFSEIGAEIALLQELFRFSLSTGFYAPTDEVMEYGAIYAPNGSWEGTAELFLINAPVFSSETDSNDGTVDFKISTGMGLYIIVGFEADISFNISTFIDQWKEQFGEEAFIDFMDLNRIIFNPY